LVAPAVRPLGFDQVLAADDFGCADFGVLEVKSAAFCDHIKDAVSFGARTERLPLVVIPSPIIFAAVIGVGAVDVRFSALWPGNAEPIKDVLFSAFDSLFDST